MLRLGDNDWPVMHCVMLSVDVAAMQVATALTDAKCGRDEELSIITTAAEQHLATAAVVVATATAAVAVAL